MLRTEDERVYAVGSIVLVPHILLSSRRHFLKAGLAGSRISRTYTGLSKVEEGDAATYLVQVVDQPR